MISQNSRGPTEAPGEPAVRTKQQIDNLVLGTVNASLRNSIDAETLAGLIQAGSCTRLSWLAAFFTEVAVWLIAAFAEHHRISRDQLGVTYRTVSRATGEHNRNLEVWLSSH